MSGPLSIAVFGGALAAALAFGSGCGSDGQDPEAFGAAAAACPSDLPAACPSTPPSYRREVATILAARCTSCHQVGGSAADKPLDSYENVFRWRSAVLHQVYACRMPPPPTAPQPADERATVLGWLVCGSTNN